MVGGPKSAFHRAATHAGSWYSDDGAELAEELGGWLEASGVKSSPLARAVIAPHAGYSYSGRCAAYAFAQLDPNTVTRVFLLGPSHHYFTRKCAVTTASVYKTPLGDIPVDLEVCKELRATGEFEEMPPDVDEAEHSMELHLPYLVHVFAGKQFKVVPILVGALVPEAEAHYGALLAPYLDNPANFFSVSSDFCHWGTRFSYTWHDKKQGPIHKSIEALDRRGMRIIEGGDARAFTAYLRESENTICGRHPIAVFLNMMAESPVKMKVSFVQYEQSSQCKSLRDSSVSYASGVATVTSDG